MNAIKKVRQYIARNPDTAESHVLARLAASLADEREFALEDLYEMELEAFELAVALITDWRLDRYYAARLKLIETIIDEAASATAAGSPPSSFASAS
jgi:ATP-dependent protease HslVU (ClpYQ) peptidase subunit